MRLINAILAGGIVSCSQTALDKRVGAANRKKRILVIGAGIAGLAAASELQKQGHDLLVLEARDRMGGRIWTSTHWLDAPLDMGATWIHGVKRNPLTAIAQQIEAQTILTSYNSNATYNLSGQILSEREEEHLEQLQKWIDLALKKFQERDDDLSIKKAIDAEIDLARLSTEDRQLVDFILNVNIEHEYAGSIQELSARWFDDDKAFRGEDALFPQGFWQIIEHLAKNLRVELGQTVKEIQRSTSSVRVVTNKAEHIADCAIVTLPLGVLKSREVRFNPELPPSKLDAIDKLGMGVLNKCFLRFPKAFWPANVDWLGYIPARHGEWAEWFSFMRSANLPVLLGFNAADRGREIESWTDEKIVASALQTLKTMFGHDIPEPLDYQITRWASDPFTFGSYSFNAVGSTPQMRKQLAESLDSRIFFAGEATEDRYFGSTHGAYLSGLRVAREISRICLLYPPYHPISHAQNC